MKLRIIILCSYLLVGLVIGYAIHFPEEVIVEKVVTVENFTTTLPDDAPVISYNEALGIIGEAKDSHLIYKAALQEGLAEPTEWTGTIADQDRIIERYDKLINLLNYLNKRE